MEIRDIEHKIENIKLNYQAEHVGLHIIRYGAKSFEALKKAYFTKLILMDMMGFLDGLLDYAGKLLDDRHSLITEEQWKAKSLLDSVQKLGEKFGLHYDHDRHVLYSATLKRKYNL